MIKAVLFDLDGVLADSRDWIYGAYQHSLSKHGFHLTNEEIHKRAGGNELTVCYKRITGLDNVDSFVSVHKDFQQQHFYLIKPFAGAQELLEVLKNRGLKIAIVSNRSKSVVQTLEKFGWQELVDAVVTSMQVERCKPHPDHVLKALELLGEKTQNAIMVGDMLEDLHSAKAADCKTIAVFYGLGGKEELLAEKPDYAVESVENLHKLLLRLVSEKT